MKDKDLLLFHFKEFQGKRGCNLKKRACKNEKRYPSASSIVQREKHPVGRPIEQQNVILLNEQETKKKEAIESKRPSKHDKKK
jgi:hypothetical protein